jgi:nicotinamidase/pyrazinamidase
MDGGIRTQSGDALILVDVQKDFLPGGSLAVPSGEQVVPVLNRYIGLFRERNLPIFATRDWHPANHCSFIAQGGPWPPHCVQGSPGAEFASDLALPEEAFIISSATNPDREAYSGFSETDLHTRLKALGIERLFIGGLATDYCVLNTVKDALALGYQVFLLRDAIRAVNVHPRDGEEAEQEMVSLGAVPVTIVQIA